MTCLGIVELEDVYISTAWEVLYFIGTEIYIGILQWIKADIQSGQSVNHLAHRLM